jgi:hypothetical protein
MQGASLTLARHFHFPRHQATKVVKQGLYQGVLGPCVQQYGFQRRYWNFEPIYDNSAIRVINLTYSVKTYIYFNLGIL